MCYYLLKVESYDLDLILHSFRKTLSPILGKISTLTLPESYATSILPCLSSHHHLRKS